jgi:predicted transcriptional regulator
LPTKPRHVTEAELAVLRLLWDRGPSTIRDLTDLIYPRGTPSQYATVQKLLERLEGKACVGRTQHGRLNVYAAAIDRDELIAHRLQETADQLCEGSLTPLLTHLVGSRELAGSELAALRELVDRLEREARSEDDRR